MGLFDASGDWDGVSRDRGMIGWAPLEGVLLKCNVNFACFKQEEAMGVCDHSSRLYGLCAEKFFGFYLCLFSPSIAEARSFCH